jgi:poly-gamma-glutamate capsule biosynthesis protein CapA/YwtB (metallophosphatase superfamily)
MHFGGDFMMGRRYTEPTRPDTPRVLNAADASRVVSDLAKMFSLADISTVNYESVVGDFALDNAKPSKLYLIQTRPETSSALLDLGVDVATLGNNHIYDWLEPGILATLQHFRDLGIASPGAGLDAAQANNPQLVQAGDVSVATISMTTVTGDYVNNRLPGATDPQPAALAPENAWQYEQRLFGFGEEGTPTYVPETSRRPGPAWELFREIEQTVGAADAANLWHDLARVYPELQDSVARRGHGGAAEYSDAAVAESVLQAREMGADLVIVQIHGSSQLAELPTRNFVEATHGAARAGADLVVGHHPHVVQGFEFYEGTLIAHSLGNLVFDQDLGVTHPSVVLRAVFEGTELLEAKVYPIVLDRYRPVLVAGEAASRIIDEVAEASIQTGYSDRLADNSLALIPADRTPSAQVIERSGIGYVVPGPSEQSTQVYIPDGAPTAADQSIRIDDATSDLILGRDLFGYGTVEDVQADQTVEGGLEWSLPPGAVEVDDTAPSGPFVVKLARTSQHLEAALARTSARLPIPPHRWTDESGAPADGPATYSARVWLKRVGAGIPSVRLSYYVFDDTNPTRLPQSAHLGEVDVPIPAVNDGAWHEYWLELPEPPPGATAMFAGVALQPPESHSGTIWFDGFAVVEWRAADQMPEGVWARADYLSTDRPGVFSVTVPASG